MNLLFGFSGRIGRLQWWLGQFFQWVVIVFCVGFLLLAIDHNDPIARRQLVHGENPSALIVLLTSWLLVAWVSLATSIKRLHDRDKSGFWLLLSFVPVIGPLWLFVECGFLPGTEGGNDFGPSPGGGFRVDDDFLESKPVARQSKPAPVAAFASPQSATRRPAQNGFGRRGL